VLVTKVSGLGTRLDTTPLHFSLAVIKYIKCVVDVIKTLCWAVFQGLWPG